MFKILSPRSLLSINGEIANRHTGVCFILCFVAPGKIFRVRGTSQKFLMQLRIGGKKFRLDTLGHEAKLECSDNCVLSKETKYPQTKSSASPSIPTGSPRNETFARLRSPYSIWLSFSVLCDRFKMQRARSSPVNRGSIV